MKLKVRFYRVHDPDLILLAKTGVDIPNEARNALISYFKNEDVHPKIERNPIPGARSIEELMPKNKNGKNERFIVHTVTVSDKDAPGIENWITSLGKGNRTCIIKAILRIYLGVVPDWVLKQLNGEILEEKPIIVDNKKKGNLEINLSEKPKAKKAIEPAPEKVSAAEEEEIDPTSVLLGLV